MFGKKYFFAPKLYLLLRSLCLTFREAEISSSKKDFFFSFLALGQEMRLKLFSYEPAINKKRSSLTSSMRRRRHRRRRRRQTRDKVFKVHFFNCSTLICRIIQSWHPSEKGRFNFEKMSFFFPSFHRNSNPDHLSLIYVMVSSIADVDKSLPNFFVKWIGFWEMGIPQFIPTISY